MSGQQLAALQAAQQSGGSFGQPPQFGKATQQYPMANDLVAQIQQQSLQQFPTSVQKSPYTTPFAINTIPGYDWAAMMKPPPTSQSGAASQQAIQQAVQRALLQQQQSGQNIPGAPGWNQPNYSMR